MTRVFSNRSFPATRLRRMRKNAFSRLLVQESLLTINDLILPVFICDESNMACAILGMPGVHRYSLDKLMFYMEKVVHSGILAVELFPNIDDNTKDALASQALRDDDVVCRAVKLIKSNFPELGVMTDVALDPYTSNGQDGIVDSDGYVVNDITNDILAKQALNHVAAGADMVSPSDMMDGRVGCIRSAFEDNGFCDAIIVAHSAKYASSLYSPFRRAVGSLGNLGPSTKETYQIDPSNISEALNEASLDIAEGADAVLVKPGMPYLDVLYAIKNTLNVPTFVYNVSGEYAMVKAASMSGAIDEKSVVLEILLSFKRAGADVIISYHALEAAKWLTAG